MANLQSLCHLTRCCKRKFCKTITPLTTNKLRTSSTTLGCWHWPRSNLWTKKTKTRRKWRKKDKSWTWWPTCSTKPQTMKKSNWFPADCWTKSTLRSTICSSKTKTNSPLSTPSRSETKSYSSISAKTHKNLDSLRIARWIICCGTIKTVWNKT